MSYDTKKLEHIEFEAHIRNEMHEIQGTKYYHHDYNFFFNYWFLTVIILVMRVLGGHYFQD
jgi:hypothetical protein